MKKYRLEDICSLITDGTHQTPVYCENDGYIFLSSKDVTTRKINWDDTKFIPEDLHEKLYSRLSPQVNDILLAKNGTTGVAAIVDRDVVFDIYVSLALLRPKDIVYPKYLLYFINSPVAKRQFNKGLKGIGVPNLHLSTIRKTELNLHDIDKQKEISKIFDVITAIIEKKQQQLDNFDTLIKSRFVEMFGDPVANNMGWDVVKLKKLSTNILSGNTPKGGSQVYVDDGIMFFRSQNVWKNRIELDDIAYIDENTHKCMAKSSLKHKDILMTKTGRINTENSSLGRAAMYMGADDQANINGHVYMIRMNDKAVKEFVLFIITTLEYRDYIRSVCVGGIDKRQLNKNHIEDFPIIMPPRDKQEEFVSIWKQVNKLKVKVQESLEENQTLFDLLMQKYFD